MKLVKKSALAATSAVALALLVSGTAFAAGCGDDEVCGLDVNVDVNADRTINGMGGIDLSNVTVNADGEITVNLPTSVTSALEFSQENVGEVNSYLNYKGQFVPGEFYSTVTAMGNSASIQTNGGTSIEGVQNNSGDIHASGNLELLHLIAIESVNLNVNAIGNNANFDSTGDLVVDSIQNNTAGTVDAYATVLLQGQSAVTTADVNVDVTAIGNNFGGKHDGALVGSIVQANCADVTAGADITVNGMRDPVNVTAVGNNISISRQVAP